jgi:hypothetical protein
VNGSREIHVNSHSREIHVRHIWLCSVQLVMVQAAGRWGQYQNVLEILGTCIRLVSLQCSSLALKVHHGV